MPQALAIDSVWLDIVPPVPPLTSLDTVSLLALPLLLVVPLLLWLFYRQRPRQRALRALRRLARNLHHAQPDTKAACFRIRQCLRDGFGRQRLYQVQHEPDNQHAWQAYLNRLRQGCFAIGTPTVDELEELIHQARHWLNQKAVNH